MQVSVIGGELQTPQVRALRLGVIAARHPGQPVVHPAAAIPWALLGDVAPERLFAPPDLVAAMCSESVRREQQRGRDHRSRSDRSRDRDALDRQLQRAGGCQRQPGKSEVHPVVVHDLRERNHAGGREERHEEPEQPIGDRPGRVIA